MAVVYLALGSNVGESVETIHRAVHALEKKLRNVALAPIYTSKAVGYTDQPDFYNTVLRGDTELSPEELLSFVKQGEKKLGRVSRFRWGPREIDIDIIFYDDVVMDSPGLTIPHPRYSERDFVLQPVVDLDPDMIDPLSGNRLVDLLEALPASTKALLRKI